MKHYMESRRTGITYMQKIKNANCFDHILSRNCHLKYVMEGKIETRMDWREREIDEDDDVSS